MRHSRQRPDLRFSHPFMQQPVVIFNQPIIISNLKLYLNPKNEKATTFTLPVPDMLFCHRSSRVDCGEPEIIIVNQA